MQCTTTTIIISNLCALNAQFQNAQFQHFIPRFDKTSLLCRPLSLKEGLGDEKRPKDSVKTG
jgi:hypothetical protein